MGDFIMFNVVFWFGMLLGVSSYEIDGEDIEQAYEVCADYSGLKSFDSVEFVCNNGATFKRNGEE